MLLNEKPHARPSKRWVGAASVRVPAVMAPSYGRMTSPYSFASVARVAPSAFRLVRARCRMARNSGNTKA